MVLRVQIQNKGEPKNEEKQSLSGRPGAGNSGPAGALSRPHRPHRLPQSLPQRTRTSLYLLQSGLVPCENAGKQTRCYKIAKADMAAYLRRRLAEPTYWTLTRSPRSQAMPPAPSAAGVPRGGSSPFPISTPIKCPKSGCWSSSPPRTTTALREKARGTTP